MKIQILTDLHIEFDHHPVLKLPGGDVLLLPGDVCVAAYLRKNRTDKLANKHGRVCREFFFHECAKYQKVYYIMGNHEHYNGIFDYTVETMREFLEGTNVTVLENEWVKLKEDWSLFGGTLWTDYNNDDWFARRAAKDKMNDHQIIKKIKPKDRLNNPYGDTFGNFLPTDAFDEHRKCIKELREGQYDMTRIDDKKIIMTHHAPTARSVHPRFAGDILNYAYYTNLEDIMLDNATVKYWFHGHMHDNHDYMVGECRVVCNPRGYAGYQLNEGFNPEFELEI